LLPIVPVQLEQIILHSIRLWWGESPNKISSVLIHRRQLLLTQIKLSRLLTLSNTRQSQPHRGYPSRCSISTHNLKICIITSISTAVVMPRIIIRLLQRPPPPTHSYSSRTTQLPP
jgi:hypothetical protein